MNPALHTIFRLICCAILCLAACGIAQGQSVGGYAGSVLRRDLTARQVAMGGVFTGMMDPDAEMVFTSGAVLARLYGHSVCAAASSPTFGQQSALLAVGAAIGQQAGIGLGISSLSVGDIAGRSPLGNPTGTMSTQDLALSLGGGLGIGPGVVGATVRYLHRGVSGADAGYNGYAVDMSGGIAFMERLFFSVELQNVAGEVKASYDGGPRETLPLDFRLDAAYVYALDDAPTASSRLDPSGIPLATPQHPASYLMAAAELRSAQTGDSSLRLCAALEAVPISGLALGLRLGANTAGDIAGGFFYKLPVSFADQLRIDYAIRREHTVNDITHHVTLTAGF